MSVENQKDFSFLPLDYLSNRIFISLWHHHHLNRNEIKNKTQEKTPLNEWNFANIDGWRYERTFGGERERETQIICIRIFLRLPIFFLYLVSIYLCVSAKQRWILMVFNLFSSHSSLISRKYLLKLFLFARNWFLHLVCLNQLSLFCVALHFTSSSVNQLPPRGCSGVWWINLNTNVAYLISPCFILGIENAFLFPFSSDEFFIRGFDEIFGKIFKNKIISKIKFFQS